MKRLGSRLNDARGTSLVEAALMTPLLLLLTLSIVDFSVLFYTYLALENGVSQATRFAVTGNLLNDPNNPANQLSRTDSIKLAMRNATPTLTIADAAFTFDHMAPGANGWAGGTGAPGDLEKLSITYPWTFYNPMLWPFFNGGQITLKVDSAMKNESRFQ
jgi:TadE-like protein